MKIRNWQIDGFGVFAAASLPEPGLYGGFNLFVGPNEAGKSTLLDFVRYTLFGYPEGRNPLPHREPLRGGKHGGTLIYTSDGVTCHLYREPGRKNAMQLIAQDSTAL